MDQQQQKKRHVDASNRTCRILFERSINKFATDPFRYDTRSSTNLFATSFSHELNNYKDIKRILPIYFGDTILSDTSIIRFTTDPFDSKHKW